MFIGGGLGSLCRFALSNYLNNGYSNLAWGTISANILSSLVLGWAFATLQLAEGNNKVIYSLIAIGFCGAFSTFSTFSLENFNFLKDGAYYLLVGNIFLNVSLCLLAVSISYNLARN